MTISQNYKKRGGGKKTLGQYDIQVIPAYQGFSMYPFINKNKPEKEDEHLDELCVNDPSQDLHLGLRICSQKC